MSFSVFLNTDVEKYLDSLSKRDQKRCYEALKKLSKDSFKPRSKCDIKKMSGEEIFYKLKVGNNSFLYIVKGEEVLVEEAFKIVKS